MTQSDNMTQKSKLLLKLLKLVCLVKLKIISLIVFFSSYTGK